MEYVFIVHVSTGIYGQFLEHIYNFVYSGLWRNLIPKTAAMPPIAPDVITAKNTLGQSDNIKVIPALATLKDHTVKFNIPPLSVGNVKLMQ